MDVPPPSSSSAQRSPAILAMVVTVAVLIGANFSVMQLALEHTTPLMLTGFRLTVGAAALLAYARFRGEAIPRDRHNLLGIFLVSICITTVSSMTLVVGVSLVPAGVAALLSSMVPVWTAVLAVLFLDERLGVWAVVGIGIGVVGAVALTSPAIEGDTSLTGVLTLIVSGIAWAMGIAVMRWWSFDGVSPTMITTVQLMMSMAVVIPIAFVVEGPAETDFGLGLLVPLLYASVPAMAVTFALMAVITRRASATQAASVAYLTPLFGVLFAWLVRNNRLSPMEWAGGALLVLGVVLVTSAPRSTSSTTVPMGQSPADGA